jgi:hypothetical protein
MNIILVLILIIALVGVSIAGIYLLFFTNSSNYLNTISFGDNMGIKTFININPIPKPNPFQNAISFGDSVFIQKINGTNLASFSLNTFVTTNLIQSDSKVNNTFIFEGIGGGTTT